MEDNTLDGLLTYGNAAKQEVEGILNAAKQMQETLKNGVTVHEASDILDRLWDVREAEEFKLKLSATDPKGNGDVIRFAELDKHLAEKMTMDVTKAFFKNADMFIVGHLQKCLDRINAMDLSSDEGLACITDLRRQVARYASFISWGVYDIREQLLSSNPLKWGDITSSTETVENGDYLFLEDLPSVLKKVHDDYAEDRFALKQWESIQSITHSFESVEAVIRLVLLFAGYLADERN